MHPRDHIKMSAAGPDNEYGPSRELIQGSQRLLHRDDLNSCDEPISDGPFLHRALDRRPEEFVYGAPGCERRHVIDITEPAEWNSPGWFQMLGQRA
jgi:hypothetical protein